MSGSAESAWNSRRLKLLRQIQFALDQQAPAKLPACGLTEAETRKLDSEGLLLITIFADDGEYLERYGIDEISPKGQGILNAANADLLHPPKALLEPTWLRACRWMGKILLGLLRLAIGPVIGGLIGYWFGSRGK